MKKLLCSAAVCGLAFAAVPAHAADGLKLDLGGYFKGYAFYTDQDEEDDDTATAGTDESGDARDFDIIRNTEIHMGGETTLDNGLTVGAHLEMEADGADGFGVQESYVYGSGAWGRVNFGAEDGAAYLLQVEAPSADDNIDGLRQFVNPVNFSQMETGGSLGALNVNGATGGIDYDQDISGYADKLTYLSPIMNGFQAGVSYTPDLADDSTEDALNADDDIEEFGDTWDVAARYEGQFNNVGVIVGAGYTLAELEESDTAVNTDVGDVTDDREAWNVGVDLDIGPFGLGVAYMSDNYGDTDALINAPEDTVDDEETWVVGADYTTGPFKFGVSYLNKSAAGNIIGTNSTNGADGIDAERWTGGVVYTYGPGMTFRGSVSMLSLDDVAGITGDDSADATSVLLGTQINF